MGERVGYGRVEKLKGFELAGFNKIPGGIKIWQVVTGKVLYLNKPARVPAGPARTIKLQQSVRTAPSFAVLHRLVLLHR